MVLNEYSSWVKSRKKRLIYSMKMDEHVKYGKKI